VTQLADLGERRGTLQLLIVATPDDEAAAREAGFRSVRLVTEEQSVFVQGAEGWALDPTLELFSAFVIATPKGLEGLRDALAIRLGDTRCKWVDYADAASLADLSRIRGATGVREVVASARRMWTDEIAGIDDVPDVEQEQLYTTGFAALDEHGFRISLPAFMPVIGPYGSGKSVLLRQLLVNLWLMHGWKCLLTSFEERIKPRYIRDLRRHIIGRPIDEWTDLDVTNADNEIRGGFKFLRRTRNAILNADRLCDRIEFAVRVYGIRVVCIDPVNELDHEVGKGESKTDYMGKFIMRLKALADDYGLLMIVAAHPPKDGVEKRMVKGKLLTLNDGADTAHWGNKADIGWCVWRPDSDGPSLLHIDKVKDHETMGRPTLAELHLLPTLNAFRIGRLGYDILSTDDGFAKETPARTGLTPRSRAMASDT
jgi:KaiC/GvpD/RAD55 family RecA-like ATPase